MLEQAPYVGAIVHYMAGSVDCAAVITTLDYRVSVPPSELEVSAPISVPSVQALMVLSAMQQPFWEVASYSEGREPSTWHWPALDEQVAVVPERIPYSGAIVHVADKVNLHMPAIVCAVAPGGIMIDAAVMNSGMDKVEFVIAIPKLVITLHEPGKDELTWHWPENPNAPPVAEPRTEE